VVHTFPWLRWRGWWVRRAAHLTCPGSVEASCRVDAACDDGNLCTSNTCSNKPYENRHILGRIPCAADSNWDEKSLCTEYTWGNGIEISASRADALSARVAVYSSRVTPLMKKAK